MNSKYNIIGGYISQDSNSQNYAGSTYYNSNSDLNGNNYGTSNGTNINEENWDQVEKSTYNSYTQNSSAGGSLYKTKLWRHFITKGYCNLGEKWNFAHGEDELRNSIGTEYQTKAWPSMSYNNQPSVAYTYQTNDQKYYKTALCRNFQENGSCQFGDNWKFAHGDTELRQTSVSSYAQVDYNSYPLTTGYGSYSTESQPTSDAYYNYGSNYTEYQDPSLSSAYVSNPTASDPADASQVYNYSYGMYPQYASGYNYEASGADGSAVVSPAMQPYYSSVQNAESKLNNKSG